MQQAGKSNDTSRTTDASYDVEVIDTEDIWSQFGPKLPDAFSVNPTKNASKQWRRIGTHAFCAALTLVLHAALLSSLLMGSASRPRVLPLSDGAAASAPNAEAREFVSTLVFLNSPSITDDETHDATPYEVPTKELVNNPSDKPVTAQLASIFQPEISGSEDGKDLDAPAIEAAGEDSGHAMLFGRYTEQIKARITRAWDYPAAAARTRFHCRVEILQGEHGEVKEVALQSCDNDPLWQVTLVQAIQRSSPLPAPPSEKVFTEILKLEFEGVATSAMTAASPN
jgi:TonB C terminal